MPEENKNYNPAIGLAIVILGIILLILGLVYSFIPLAGLGLLLFFVIGPIVEVSGEKPLEMMRPVY